MTGTKIRVLTIMEASSRYAPAIMPRLGFRAPGVIEVPERFGAEIGLPRTIRLDQGGEFSFRDPDPAACQRGVTLDFSRLTKPADNAFIESLNGKFRADCVNAHWFTSLDDAARQCAAWRRDDNELRPHSSNGN